MSDGSATVNVSVEEQRTELLKWIELWQSQRGIEPMETRMLIESCRQFLSGERT